MARKLSRIDDTENDNAENGNFPNDLGDSDKVERLNFETTLKRWRIRRWQCCGVAVDTLFVCIDGPSDVGKIVT